MTFYFYIIMIIISKTIVHTPPFWLCPFPVLLLTLTNKINDEIFV